MCLFGECDTHTHTLSAAREFCVGVIHTLIFPLRQRRREINTRGHPGSIAFYTELHVIYVSFLEAHQNI